MAQLQLHQACNIFKGIHEQIFLSNYKTANKNNNKFIISRKKRDISDQTVKIDMLNNGRRGLLLQVDCTASSSSSSSSSSTSTSSVHEVKNGVAESRDSSSTIKNGGSGVLLSENGWKVRRMIESDEEMRMVASIQAEAFHHPVSFFNNFFMESFKAEVLSGLIYRLRNSPPNRYACLVAEPSSMTGIQQLIGVVDITVLRDNDTLQYLEDAEEYLYVSGIAVSRKFRRQKVATALLGACEKVSNIWGFEYLALRAYEDDSGACTLYKNAGFFVVGKDPQWMTTWLGRRRRVLMIKRSNNNKLVAFQKQEAKDVHTL